jgi:hypothetical protein
MGASGSYKANLSLNRVDKTEINLLSVWNIIYYREIDFDENDEPIYQPGDKNEAVSKFIITQEFINSLKPGDELILEGEGEC